MSEDINQVSSDMKWLISEVERLRVENERLDRRMKDYEKRAVHLAAENDLLKAALKQADGKRIVEIIGDSFKEGD